MVFAQFAKVFSTNYAPKTSKRESFCKNFRVFFDTRKFLLAKVSAFKVLILQRNLVTLLAEMYNSISTCHPNIVRHLFSLKESEYWLRNQSLLKLPPTRTVQFSMNSFSFRGCLLWNMLPQCFINSSTIKVQRLQNHGFKDNCPCSLCKKQGLLFNIYLLIFYVC